ncbi:hypothetical protein [Mesorhizobium sp.]|uniref:hypothetical protein n=1 Tax=Mesorhizobium sp. TaxID=1871066 RepID=UPI001228C341|nr:hypothetical protein [Mesorhizobium sp.]TIL43412.1 MAG: hypothetical protein E5Y86_22465 [Mesorhizobium sp.]
MRTDFAAYENTGLSREYLEILEAEQAEINPDSVNPTRPMDADRSRNSMCSSEAGRKLVSDWEQMGGFRVHLGNVQRDVGEMVRAAGGNREQRIFLENFSRSVPMGAEIALIDEIAAGRGLYVAPASSAEIKLFASTPAGRTLMEEWGSVAAERVAMLRSRAARMTANMSEDESADFWTWFDNLEPGPVAAIFRKLAG